MFTISKKIQYLLLPAALGMALSAPAMSAPNEVLKTTWQPVADVKQDQAQVVYFRPTTESNAKENTNIYVDGEFQSALIPGSYATFCVKPGAHTLGSWNKDDPSYQGKQDLSSKVNLEGGKTYYIRGGEGTATASRLLQKNQAASLLQGTRQQDILLSRASAVTNCQYTYQEYSLASDVLFAFGKSSEKSMKVGGREDIAKIAGKIASNSSKVVVIGHTDPIGSVKGNLALGLKRAQTVRQLLIEDGVSAANISATTMGSQEPVAQGCSALPKQQKIACYAPDRRVVIRSYAK